MFAALPIYSRVRPASTLTLAGRLTALGVALAGLALLSVGAGLRAERGGAGTHTQLGLAPCGLLRVTGIPCVTCGMTTAVTHVAHGRWLSALWTQPAGAGLGIAAAVAWWGGAYVAWTGRPAHRILRRFSVASAALATAALLLGAWAWKIVLTLVG